MLTIEDEGKIANLLQIFKLLPTQEQREHCLDVLSWAKQHWGVFEELHSLLTQGKETTQERYHIYKCALEMLYEIKEEDRIRSLEELQKIRNTLGKMRMKELEEKNQDTLQTEKLLEAF